MPMCAGMLSLLFTPYTGKSVGCARGLVSEVLCARNSDGLIPDAPELIHTYLEGEQDASCKRNAFMMLIHVDRVSVC